MIHTYNYIYMIKKMIKYIKLYNDIYMIFTYD